MKNLVFPFSGFTGLACLFLLGCEAAPQFNPADAEGPAASFGGRWLAMDFNGACQHLWGVQEGDALHGYWMGLEFKGTIKGRVALLENGLGTMAVTMAPNGKTAQMHEPGFRIMEHVSLFREKLGPASEDPRTSGNPLLSGGLLCHAAVGKEGSTQSYLGGSVRLVLATLENETFGETCNSYVILTPVDNPCRRVQVMPSTPDPDPDIKKQQYGGQLEITYDEIRAARKNSPIYAKQPCEVEGKPGWWVMCPAWEEEGAAPTLLIGELYRQDPDTGAKPTETFEIARLVQGQGWVTVAGYRNPMFTPNVKKLVKAQAVIEQGKPVRVEFMEVTKPPIEDFLLSKERSHLGGTARNNLLLKAKNQTLPDMLREGKTEELTRIFVRIRQLVSDLEREITRVNDRAQKMMENETQKFMAPLARQLADTYRERTEILKPIQAALQAEISNRQK